MLEGQQGKLVSAIQELYKRAIEKNAWDGMPLPNGESKSCPLTHDILMQLGVIKPRSKSKARAQEDDDEEEFVEDTELLLLREKARDRVEKTEEESKEFQRQVKDYWRAAQQQSARGQPPTPPSANPSDLSGGPSPMLGYFPPRQQFKSEQSPAQSPAVGIFSQQQLDDIAQHRMPAGSVTPDFSEDLEPDPIYQMQMMLHEQPQMMHEQSPMMHQQSQTVRQQPQIVPSLIHHTPPTTHQAPSADVRAQIGRAQQQREAQEEIARVSIAMRNNNTSYLGQVNHTSLQYIMSSMYTPSLPTTMSGSDLDPSWSPAMNDLYGLSMNAISPYANQQ